MRWRYLKLDLPYLLCELVIVVLGVLIALGANGWYEDWRERQTEETYLARISDALALGSDQLIGLRDRMTAARDAGARFVEMVESGSFSDEAVLDSFLYASLVGFTESDLLHDVTYRELVSTGNLNVVSDDSLRVSISEYYRGLDGLSQVALTSITAPNSILRSLTAMTGKFPEQFTGGDEDKSNDTPFSASEKERILEKIASDRALILQDTRSQLSLQNILLEGFFPTVIQRNQDVREAIAQAP